MGYNAFLDIGDVIKTDNTWMIQRLNGDSLHVTQKYINTGTADKPHHVTTSDGPFAPDALLDKITAAGIALNGKHFIVAKINPFANEQWVTAFETDAMGEKTPGGLTIEFEQKTAQAIAYQGKGVLPQPVGRRAVERTFGAFTPA